MIENAERVRVLRQHRSNGGIRVDLAFNNPTHVRQPSWTDPQACVARCRVVGNATGPRCVQRVSFSLKASLNAVWIDGGAVNSALFPSRRRLIFRWTFVASVRTERTQLVLRGCRLRTKAMLALEIGRQHCCTHECVLWRKQGLWFG